MSVLQRALAVFAPPLMLLALAAPSGAVREPAENLEQATMARLAAIQAGAEEPPRPFTTDGCSGGLSAAWRGSCRPNCRSSP